MGVRLHYLLSEIDVPRGEFLIGRAPECQLVLADPLVSRRHARLRVAPGGTTLEDAGSRHGIQLNGVQIRGPEPLRDGDVFRVGSQDITFRDVDEARQLDVPSALRAGRRPLESRQDLMGDDDTTNTGVALAPLRQGLGVIGGVAEKAIALGRAEDAERLLQRWLADVLAGAATGDVDLELAERAASYAVRLAGATGRGVWVDYAFRLYTALRALLPARLVDELYDVARRAKPIDRTALRAYTARLREISSRFGPAERFVHQRIEGFERWLP